MRKRIRCKKYNFALILIQKSGKGNSVALLTDFQINLPK